MIERLDRSFVRAPRQDTDGGDHVGLVCAAQRHIIRTPASCLHQRARAADAGAQTRVHRGAEGHRRFEIPGDQKPRHGATPVRQRLGDALARDSGREEAAVKQHQIRTHEPLATVREHRAMVTRQHQCRTGEECRKVPRDRGIGLERQPELAQPQPAISRGGSRIRLDDGQELVERGLDLHLRQLHPDRFADDAAAGAEDRDRDLLRRGIAQHPLLRRTAGAAERCPLRDRETQSQTGGGHLPLDECGERQVDVVAAEQEVIADRHPLERGGARLHPDSNQAEI